MKIDFHVHSKYSSDSLTKLSQIYKQAKKTGLGGLALTDHDEFQGVAEFQKFLREERDKDFLLIPGMEIKMDKGEIIALFLQAPIQSRDLVGIIEEAKQQEALLCLPHPFDKVRRVVPKISQITKQELAAIDAIEVFNGRMLDQKANKVALEFAWKNNKAQLGGSDAHWWFEVGTVRTEINGTNIEEIKKEIKKKRTIVNGKGSNPLVLGLTKGVKITKKLLKRF